VLKKSLGKQIYRYRKQRKLSQEKLAELSDYSVDFISLVERGHYSPSVEGCARIAQALQIKLKTLFDIEIDPELSKKLSKTKKKP